MKRILQFVLTEFESGGKDIGIDNNLSQETYEKYTKSYYKWVSSTGKVILSISATNSAYWIGVASKNNDSTRGGYPSPVIHTAI